MKKALKWFLVLLLLFVLMLVGAFAFINHPIVKQPLVDRVSESIGRPLHLNGPIHITWGDPWQFSLNDVVMDNAVWGSSPHALKVDKFRVNIDTSELFSGKLAIEEISLLKPQIWIESKDGQSNWQFKQAQSQDAKNENASDTQAGYPKWLLLQNIHIKDGQLFYYQRGKPQQLNIQNINFSQNQKTATLQANLSMHDKKLALLGKTLALPRMINNEEQADFSLSLTQGNADKVDMTGSLKLGKSHVNVDADINVNIADLAAYSKIADVTLPAILNIQGQAKLHNNTDDVNVLSLTGLSLNSVSHGLNVNLNGAIEDLTSTQGMQVNVDINGQTSAKQLLPELENDFNISTDIKGNIASDENDIRLNIESARFNSNIADANIGNNSISLKHDWQEPLPLTVRIDDMTRMANTLDIDLPAVKDVVLSAALLRKDNGLEIHRFDINSQDEHIVASSNGNLVYRDGKWQGVESLQLKVDATVLNHWLEGLSDTGMQLLTLKTQVTGQGDYLSFENLSIISNPAEQAQEPILQAQGRWQNIANITSLDLETTVSLPSLAALSTISQTRLPDEGPLKMTAKVIGNDEKLNINDMALTLNNQNVAITVDGQYQDVLSEGRELALNIDSEFKNAETFRVFLPSQDQASEKTLNTLSLFMPATASAELGFAQRSLRLQNINIQSDAYGLNSQISGNIDSSQPWQGQINIVSQGSLDLNQIEQTLALSNLPPALDGKLNLNADVVANENQWGLSNIQMELDSGHSQINAKGSVPSFAPLSSEEFAFKVKSDDLYHLLGHQPAINQAQKVDINLHLHGSNNPTEKQAMDVDAKIGDSDIQGAFDWQGGQDEYVVSAKLLSDKIDLDSLLAKGEGEKEDKPSGPLFTDRPFSLDWMQTLNIDFNWQIKQLIGAILTMQNVDANLDLENKKMLSNIKAQTQRGTFNAQLDMQDNGAGLALQLKLDGDNIETAAITQLGLQEVIDKSELNFRINLAGQGQSSRQLMSSIDGVVEMRLGEAELKNSLLDWVGGDIITGLVGAINPIKRKEENINLQCASVYINIDDGLIDEKDFVGLKTDKVTMLGDAKINLADESMELYFVPRANKGLGISASTVAKMVRIGGTFSQPKIETDAEGLLKSGAAVGLAVATGGWTLVAQGLFDRFESSQDICERVIEKNADDEPVTEYKREVVKHEGDKKLIRVQVPDEPQDTIQDESKNGSTENKNNQNDDITQNSDHKEPFFEPADPATER